MNIQLTENIVRHVLANLVIIPSDYIDPNRSQSLISKEYLLKEKMKIELDDNSSLKNNIYGCKMQTGEQEITILMSDCTQEKEVPEFCLVVHLKNAPVYGLYLVYNDFDDAVDSDPMLACSLDGKSWMPCNTYLQATFLAGMEQIKETGFGWTTCSDYKYEYDSMLSFLDFYISFYEAKNARQEN